ncbi:WD40-repeat-containing domain protein [Phlebopus sp. FC_14]|nr:WD40-repeat-containing domain protein [Phlebopus sp. FC_14]
MSLDRMSLLQSPSLKIIDKALGNTSLPGNNYVLSLTALDNHYAASASSPSNQIHLFDRASLQAVRILSGHDIATSHLRTINALGMSSRAMLLSSGKDGCVKAWDERTGTTSIEMVTSGRLRPLLCCDASNNGLTVAAGTDLQKEDAFILYWDPRNPAAPLRTHGSTHSDDITAVHFLKYGPSPSSRDVLFSTSSDGLICTSNSLEDDEDEAVLHVGNWGCSVSQGGWICDARGTRVWAASDMETFSYWSTELDRIQDIDIRNPSLHHHGHTWVTDYLITCHSTPRAESGLGVFVGSNEGDVALISSRDLSDASVAWTIHSIWTTGHNGVVRSILWDEENRVLVTGGEDSKINAWHVHDMYATSSSQMGDQKGDDMELDSHGLKREWDDSMDISDIGSVSYSYPPKLVD